MSAEVTEPYSVSFSPTRRAISTSICASRWRERFGLRLLLELARLGELRSRSICRLLLSVTASASLRGSR